MSSPTRAEQSVLKPEGKHKENALDFSFAKFVLDAYRMKQSASFMNLNSLSYV